MKPAVIGVAAFLVGLAGGTFLAKAPEHEGEGAEVAGQVAPVSPPVFEPTVPSEGAAAGAAATPEVRLPPVAGTDEADTVSVVRLVAILDQLKPADVPALLGLMTDQQVEQVLRSMAVDRAAKVLQAMPSERGAYFSRRLLLPPGSLP